VRPPDGRAAALTRPPAMRTPRTALLALLVAFAALVVAGCGGGEVDADEVPGAAPALSVPSDSDIGSGDSASSDSNSSTDDSSSSDTSDDTSDSGTSGTGTTGTGSTGTGTTGGTTTPSTGGTTGGTGTGTGTTTPSTGDGGTTDTPPAAGSAPEQFESFCEQNAGAC